MYSNTNLKLNIPNKHCRPEALSNYLSFISLSCNHLSLYHSWVYCHIFSRLFPRGDSHSILQSSIQHLHSHKHHTTTNVKHSPRATIFETEFTVRSCGITFTTFPTLSPCHPPSLPLCVLMGWLQERKRASPSPWRLFFENMWPENNWVTTIAVQWIGLDLENDSIHFCLSACCFHSCSFYPPFRLRTLLYRPGRQPEERVENNLSINILTYIQWVEWEKQYYSI